MTPMRSVISADFVALAVRDILTESVNFIETEVTAHLLNKIMENKEEGDLSCQSLSIPERFSFRTSIVICVPLFLHFLTTCFLTLFFFLTSGAAF